MSCNDIFYPGTGTRKPTLNIRSGNINVYGGMGALMILGSPDAARVQSLYDNALIHLRMLVERNAWEVEDALDTVLANHVLGLVQRGLIEDTARQRYRNAALPTAAVRYRRAMYAATHLKTHALPVRERLRFADVNANATVALREGHGDYFRVLRAIARATGEIS